MILALKSKIITAYNSHRMEIISPRLLDLDTNTIHKIKAGLEVEKIVCGIKKTNKFRLTVDFRMRQKHIECKDCEIKLENNYAERNKI